MDKNKKSDELTPGYIVRREGLRERKRKIDNDFTYDEDNRKSANKTNRRDLESNRSPKPKSKAGRPRGRPKKNKNATASSSRGQGQGREDRVGVSVSKERPGQNKNPTVRLTHLEFPIPKPKVVNGRGSEASVPPGSVNKNADSSESVSVAYRCRGNEYYKKYVDSSNFQDQKKYLQTAIQFYRQAYDAVKADNSEQCDDESATYASSAAKNIGTASVKLVQVLEEINAHEETIERQFTEGIEFFSKACYFGKKGQNAQWNKEINVLYDRCVEASLRHLREKDSSFGERTGGIETNIRVMIEDSHKSQCFLEIATFTFQRGIVALAEKNFKDAIYYFHECHRPVQECKRYVKLAVEDSDHFEKEARVMEVDLVFHMASAESLQAISIGDKLLESVLKDQENLNMDMVYTVLDWYKKAIIGAREIDVEMEAWALSRLGRLYDQVLKIKYKAKEYFLRCMQLSVSLFPRDMNSEEWLIVCMKTLKKYQMEAARTDDAEQRAKNKKYLAELKDELKKLKDANTDAASLVKFVYKTFPPKNPNHTVPNDEELEPDGGKLKKILLKAILHYHPDKQDVEKHGRKWQVLCDEITKCLTNRYECFKLGT